VLATDAPRTKEGDMKRLIMTALVLLSAVAQVSVAVAQTPSTNQNQQGMPWFTRPQGMPGMPWFFRPPAPVRQAQCWIAYWHPAQFWNTDQWGQTVTWTDYAPHYVCTR
jgi:hypothetical protein